MDSTETAVEVDGYCRTGSEESCDFLGGDLETFEVAESVVVAVESAAAELGSAAVVAGFVCSSTPGIVAPTPECELIGFLHPYPQK